MNLRAGTYVLGIVSVLMCGGPGLSQAVVSGGVPRLGARFIENRGQWEGDFRYRVKTEAMTVFVGDEGWTFTIDEFRETPAEDLFAVDGRGVVREHVRGVAVRMRFGGGRAERIVPEMPAPGLHNFFLGSDPSRWRTDVPHFDELRLVGAWSGIDVATRVDGGNFKYDVLAAPGADLSEAIIEVDGAERMSLDQDGGLRIETALGTVRQPAPIAWQVAADGRRVLVPCSYVRLDARRFAFSAPERDDRLPLVIDPPLIFGTYLLGPTDEPIAMAVDGGGATTLVGETYSATFPATPGAYDVTYGGGGDGNDGFVAQLAAGGGALVFATFLGSATEEDTATGVAIGATGEVTVIGVTRASNFPTTPGAFDTTYNGGSSVGDGFVTRLTAAGNALVYSTFLGGGANDSPSSLVLHSSGAAVVAGATRSLNFPTTPGAYDPSANIPGSSGSNDAFVSALLPNGSGLICSTLLGGTADDYVTAIALDATGAVTVVGGTYSANFPVSAGAYSVTYSGYSDGFVARLSAGLSTLDYATFLGSGSYDTLSYVALDGSGAVVVAGHVINNFAPPFPTTPAAFDTTPDGFTDAVVAKLTPNGTALIFSTFLGGADVEYLSSVGLDAAGAVIVAGRTESDDFPVTPGAFVTPPSIFGADVFATRVAADGSTLLHSARFGGSSHELTRAAALDASGTAYIVGQTSSTDFPTTPGVLHPTPIYGSSTFVVAIQLSCPFALSLAAGGSVGGFSLTNVCGSAWAPYVTALTFDPANGTNPGGGWWAGLHLDPTELYDEIVLGLTFGPAVPFVGVLDQFGASSWTLPSGLPPGLPTMYGVTRVFSADLQSIIADSNIAVLQP